MPFIKNQAVAPVIAEEREHEREYPDLILGLGDGNPTIRRWSARDLRGHPEAASVLVNLLKREADVSVREVILTTLISFGGREVGEGLVDCLRSEDAALRNEAIEALQQLPDEVAVILPRLQSDQDPDVRIFAVNILESLRHPKVESWLIEVIGKETHINVCSAALDLLNEVGTLAAAPAIEQLAARFPEEPYIQFTSNLVLKRIRGS